MSVPGTKKSCVNLVPGLPSFARSVITEALLLSKVAACELAALPAPATPLAKKPPPPPPANPLPPPPPPPPGKVPPPRKDGTVVVVVV